MRAAAPALMLSVQFADATDRALLPRHRLRRWLAAALQEPAEIGLRIVDEAEGRTLNREFRAKDHATNVLTFDYAREPAVVADIVLCGPVVRREAAEQNIALEAHYAHLIVHGALHARGFDHDSDLDAEIMESRETAVLARLGFADPYAR